MIAGHVLEGKQLLTQHSIYVYEHCSKTYYISQAFYLAGCIEHANTNKIKEAICKQLIKFGQTDLWRRPMLLQIQ